VSSAEDDCVGGGGGFLLRAGGVGVSAPDEAICVVVDGASGVGEGWGTVAVPG
jgi:hypothetical protein